MAEAQARTRNRRGEGDQLRTDLLDAAVELLAQHGSVDKVSLRAVASAAGVSPTAVYRHFENHEQLMVQSVLACWTMFEDALTSEDTDNVDEDFYRMGLAYIRFANEEPGRYRVLFTPEILRLPQVKPAGTAVFERLTKQIERLLVARDDDRDPRFVAQQVHTWMHGMVLLCRDGAEHPWGAVEPLLADLPIRLGLYG